MFFLRKGFFVLIGLALFIYILLKLNIFTSISYIFKMNLFFFLLYLVLNAFIVIIKGLKWKILILPLGKNKSIFFCVKYFLVGFFWSVITPGRIGEFVRAFYLNKDLKNLGKSFSTVFIDRVLDVLVLLFLGALAILLFSFYFNLVLIFIPILLGALFVALVIIIFFFKKKLVKKILKPFFGFFIPESYKKKISLNFDSFYNSLNISIKKPKYLVSAFIFTFLIWFLSMIAGYLIALSLNIQTSFLFIALIIPIINLVDIIPISISGIGTRDAALIFLFGFVALSKEQAVSFSLIYLFSGYFLIALAGSLLFIRESIKPKFNLEDN
ncbi:MAG: lysylphosphatidylglycerol synthase transmembrane domain-containing protein [Candidatus Diapherotrites archaeon]